MVKLMLPTNLRVVKYVQINPAAQTKLQELLETNPEYAAIRVSIQAEGCNGFSYHLEYATEDNITPNDEVVEVKQQPLLYIDPKAVIFLIGSEMVYRETELESGFDFVNPNETSRCSCGKSIGFNGESTNHGNCLTS